MLVPINSWCLQEWSDWLNQETDLQLGQDYCWAWYNNNWAISINDPATEFLTLLKTSRQMVRYIPE